MLNLLAKSNGESIRQHTDKLLSAFEEFNNIYGSSFDEKLLKIIRYACEYHDYGKVSYIVQKMLGSKERSEQIEKMYKEIGFEKNIPHGYISPAFLNIKELKNEFDEEDIFILVTAIYYHHNRASQVSGDELKRVINEDLKIRIEDRKISTKYLNYILGNDVEEPLWIKYASAVGMLNKFDYYASCTDDKLPVEIDGYFNGNYISGYVKKYFKKNNWQFRDVQLYASENSDKNIVIIASTGIGKTEAALLWSGNDKLFYTLPLKVSINAMYERMKSEYDYSEEKVTLLHSDALSALLEEETDEMTAQLKYDASRRLSYPVTVCTVDQIFTFVYKYRGCEQILATLKYSKIVVDEIQSYSPDIIAKLIYGLKLISEAGGRFAIITATLPPVLLYFMRKYNIKHEDPKQFLLTDKIRHRIHYESADDFDYDLITEMASDKKVLIICNKVDRAIEVYEKLKERCEYVKVLHSKFIRRHRRILEQEILSFSDDRDKSGIWITTQIVEASLDIDFDVLFTEMCTIDSLLQRMGRCYRKRDYSGNEQPNIYIVDNRSGYGTVYEYTDIYDRSVDCLQKYQDEFFSEQDKMACVEKVYNTEEIRDSKYFNDISDRLNTLKYTAPFIIQKNEAKNSFRDIEKTFSTVPKSVYDMYTDEFDSAVSVLQNKRCYDISERNNAVRFIEDNALSVSITDKRNKERDRSILGTINYYTLDYLYDFDEETVSGCGLTKIKNEDSNFI